MLLAVLHGIEHVYIYAQYVETGISDGPGLFGLGGAIGVIPFDRLDLHNIYNGLETVLIVLGFWNETDILHAESEEE